MGPLSLNEVLPRNALPRHPVPGELWCNAGSSTTSTPASVGGRRGSLVDETHVNKQPISTNLSVLYQTYKSCQALRQDFSKK